MNTKAKRIVVSVSTLTDGMTFEDARIVAAEFAQMTSKIAELEAQLDAVGAGGVSRLMGVEPAQPVAWQCRAFAESGGWNECGKEAAEVRAKHPDKWQVRALYAAPQPAAQPAPERQPLTDKAIADLMPTNASMSMRAQLYWIARAVERHHGIQGASHD